MKKFVSLAVFGLLLAGTTGCSQIKQNDVEEPVEVVQPVLSIRKLSSGTDSNDHSFVKFNYTISPSNASDRSIILNLSWVNKSVDDTISDYLTASADESDCSITVTCLQNFANQANLNVMSASNRECSVDIPIDYEVRLEQFNFNELKASSSYTIDGQTVQPWWNGTASSITDTYYPDELALTCDYWDYGNITANTKIFNFPFYQYINRAAVYSYGTVDAIHETLNSSISLGSFSMTPYGSVSTNWPNKVKAYFEDLIADILYYDYTYMTLDAFNTNASTWAAQYLTAAEASDLHNNMFHLGFDIDVTYSASNGVSDSISISFDYSIAGRFFDIPVSSLTVDGDSHTF